jgi:flagellar M-ring protein FliF
VVGTLVAMLFIARTATQPGMSLLYGGLDAKASGEVVAALDALGVQNEVRGDSIYVPSTERDRARMSLAKDGLPQQGQAGYELLDNLSGFGTTTEMFQAAYWRAKEGELARTILAVPGVRSARVHIGAQSRRPFERQNGRSSAAVTVSMGNGRLTESSALSMRFLVALAVPGLEPGDVAVIDARNGVVLKPGDDQNVGLTSADAERKSEALRQELEALLGVRVGAGKVRVSVAVETTTESRTVSERILDPDSQVTISSETNERRETSKGAAQAVTVASNLPDGEAAGGGGSESSQEETHENVSYQYSETRRDETVQPGAVKRIGVAVLVDEVETVAEDGAKSYSPRSAEELDAIEQLVKSAIAFDADRGDVVTVESMRFAAVAPEGVVAEAGAFERMVEQNLGSIIQLGILGLVALALAFFVVRPILTQAKAEPDDGAVEAALAELEAEGRAAIGSDGGALALEQGADPTVDGEALALDNAAANVPAMLEKTAAEQAALAYAAQEDAQASAENAVAKSRLDLLREIVGDKPDETVALLKRWLGAPPAEGANGGEVR